MTFYLYVFPIGTRIAVLRVVSREAARALAEAEGRERGETVLPYNDRHRVVPAQETKS